MTSHSFNIVQVVSVRFDPHYLDADKNVTVDEYGETAMYFIKTSPGIFGLPSVALTQVSCNIEQPNTQCLLRPCRC